MNPSTIPVEPKVEVDIAAIRLKRAWRTFASSIAVVSSRASAAERSASTSSSSSNTNASSTTTNTTNKRPAIDDESLVTTFKAKSELKKMIGLLEGRIKNESRENELVKSFWRSEPCVGMKRRKVMEVKNGNTTAVDNDDK